VSGQLRGRWGGLDALRGLSIAAMILVNNPGRWGREYQYSQLRHADWHGCTFTDLVFPTFLFCAGVAIVPALSRKLAQGDSERLLVRGILRRVISLILLGMFVSAFPLVTFAADRGLFDPLWSTRFPGVLQRIGVCYGVAALLFVFASVRTQRMVLVACLLIYWPLVTLVEVPGFGPPDIGTAMGTLQGYVDRAVFGSHIWVKGQYDPEGLLSTMPALATCLFGVEAGRLLQRTPAPMVRVKKLACVGGSLLVLGAGWSLLLPLNKYLWTSSYAVWTAGVATSCLAGCVWAFEERGWSRFAYPLQVYGINALLVFVGSAIVGRIIGSLVRFEVGGSEVSLKGWFFDAALLSIADPKVASLLFAVIWIAAWFLVLRALYNRGLIWKV
jgi:predicted acyltransferase